MSNRMSEHKPGCSFALELDAAAALDYRRTCVPQRTGPKGPTTYSPQHTALRYSAQHGYSRVQTHVQARVGTYTLVQLPASIGHKYIAITT